MHGIEKYELKNGGISWRAHQSVKGKNIYLGSFNSEESAIAARKAYAEEHGIKPPKAATVINATPELIASVKKLSGISFYRQFRTGEIIGFRADIMRDGRKKYLGKFDKLDDAINAYVDASDQNEKG